MKNVSVRDRSYLIFETITVDVNGDDIDDVFVEEKHNGFPLRDIIKLQLEIFEKIIQLTYIDLLKYAKQQDDEQVQLPVNINDMFYEYDQTIQHGIPKITKLINQLDRKKVNHEAFQYMQEIIDYQMKVTKNLIERGMTIERLEVLYNHLLNVPYYLESDLEIDTLANVNVIEIRTTRKEKTETSAYDLSIKSKYYISGA